MGMESGIIFLGMVMDTLPEVKPIDPYRVEMSPGEGLGTAVARVNHYAAPMLFF
jgi:hypothetical protein